MLRCMFLIVMMMMMMMMTKIRQSADRITTVVRSRQCGPGNTPPRFNEWNIAQHKSLWYLPLLGGRRRMHSTVWCRVKSRRHPHELCGIIVTLRHSAYCTDGWERSNTERNIEHWFHPTPIRARREDGTFAAVARRYNKEYLFLFPGEADVVQVQAGQPKRSCAASPRTRQHRKSKN